MGAAVLSPVRIQSVRLVHSMHRNKRHFRCPPPATCVAASACLLVVIAMITAKVRQKASRKAKDTEGHPGDQRLERTDPYKFGVKTKVRLGRRHFEIIRISCGVNLYSTYFAPNTET